MLPYSPSDINSCYSYVSPAGSRKRMEEAALPLPFFLSFPTRTRFVSSHRKDHQHFQDYLEEKLCLIRKKWTVDIDETVIVRFFTSELRENVVQLRDTVL